MSMNLSLASQQAFKQECQNVQSFLSKLNQSIESKELEQLTLAGGAFDEVAIGWKTKLEVFISMVNAEKLINDLTEKNKALEAKVAELETAQEEEVGELGETLGN